MGRGPQIRPVSKDCYNDCKNVTPAACAATLRDGWCVAESEPWKQAISYLMRPPTDDVAKEQGTQATAQFLLTRGPFSWIGFFDWQSLANWPRPVEWPVHPASPSCPRAADLVVVAVPVPTSHPSAKSPWLNMIIITACHG